MSEIAYLFPGIIEGETNGITRIVCECWKGASNSLMGVKAHVQANERQPEHTRKELRRG